MKKYLAFLTFPDKIMRQEVEAESYWEACLMLAPGSDCIKVELIEL